jgi:release factor glutamine methyltransferase
VHVDSRSDTWTVLKILRWTTEFLKNKGVETARLDAEVLLADLLGLSRVDLYLNFDRPLIAEELAGYRERVKRRGAREPVAYIIGRKEFYSLELKVNKDVLIPRPETELLVDEALELVRERFPNGDLALADVGTGSGAIAMALASELERAQVWATDIWETSLEVARENAERLGVSDRLVFLDGDLAAPLITLNQRFHLVLANLPYVPEAAFEDMAPDVRVFEPRRCLAGGTDGLDLIRRLVETAPDLLVPGGALILEIWPDHGKALKEFGASLGFSTVRIRKDMAGRDRVAVMEWADKD